MTKQRHHYIPQCYSRGFLTDGQQTLFEYTKGTPAIVGVRTPKNMGVERYYYAFEHPEGYRDTDTLEDTFSKVEAEWTRLVQIFERDLVPYPEHLDSLFTFMALMRVRVPNFRLCLEAFLAEQVRSTAMVTSKHHPELTDSHTDLVNKALERGDHDAVEALKKMKNAVENGEVIVSIDPQKSLMGIGFVEKFRAFFHQLNWVVIHTPYDIDFVTSDNPVVWYDLKRLHETGKFIPYADGLISESVQVIMPVTKKMMLVGNRLGDKKLMYGSLTRKSKVKELNRFMTISAERFVYASQGNLTPLVQKYSDIAPRLRFSRTNHADGKGIRTDFEPVLDDRKPLPKWKKAG